MTTTWEDGNLEEVFDNLFKQQDCANKDLFGNTNSLATNSLSLSDDLNSFSSEDIFSSNDDSALGAPLSSSLFEPAPLDIMQPPALFSLDLTNDSSSGAVEIKTTPLGVIPMEGTSDDSDTADDSPPPSRKRSLAVANSACVALSDEGKQVRTRRAAPRRAATAARTKSKKFAADLDDSSYDPSTSSSTTSSGSSTPKPKPKRRGRRAAREIIAAEGIIPDDKPKNVDPAIAAVALSRERLLTITSVEMEKRFNELHASRHLSQAEMKELRRQRRLVKNREYAQQSRNKKKVAQESIASTISNLRKDNSKLRSTVSSLESEANDMRSRIEAAMTAASSLGQQGSELLNILMGVTSEAPPAKRRRGATTANSGAASSAVLFVMLFSFGLFMNGDFFSSSSSASTVVKAPLAHTDVHQQQQQQHAPAAPGPLYTGRALLCNEDVVLPTTTAAFLEDTRAIVEQQQKNNTTATLDAMPHLVAAAQ